LRKLWNKATFFRLNLTDHVKVKGNCSSNDIHLNSAIEWLKRAQDSTGDGGVSGGYFENIGWDASYPETTGYIIPTFFDYANYAQDSDCRTRAVKMGEYLLSIQLESGAFKRGSLGAFPIGGPEVFDTGQILQGLIRCYQETQEERFYKSAVKAGDWIVEAQESNGSWVKYSYHDIAHTFYTRVAINLLELNEISEKKKYREAAYRNIEWALTKCNIYGWYEDCGAEISLMSSPWTHFIAYATEGILTCGIKFRNQDFILSAKKTMDALLDRLNVDGWIKGSYDEKWKSIDRYSCLVGDAQIALNWLKLFEITHSREYLDGAIILNQYLKSTQRLYDLNKGIQGGIKGSHPIHGKYNHHRYINWAAKYFADLQIKLAFIYSNNK
jgi:hypothetical protein